MRVAAPRCPRVEMDCDKVMHNTRVLVEKARRCGVKIAGVTKGVCGNTDIARAMLKGGVTALADSRTENLQKLKDEVSSVPLMLLRAPSLSSAEEAVCIADSSLNSEITTVRALGEAACRMNRVHEVILMVDIGDLREGVWPDQACPTARAMDAVPGITVSGIGANLSCYGGVIPNKENMALFAEIAEAVARSLGREAMTVSGGNSSNVDMLLRGDLPPAVNQLRIGESILLGCYPSDRSPIEGLYQDAFTLVAEVIEVGRKPSVPIGQRAQDAFGNLGEFQDRGWIARAILACGRQDVLVDGLRPVEEGVQVMGASSDQLLLDITGLDGIHVGSEMRFSMSYGCLLAAMTSPYVSKVVV